MPLGILDDDKLEHIPGTAPLNGLDSTNAYTGVDPGLLKHDPTGQIVLVPQPSESPNDPYNWPRRKKELFTLTFAWGCGCVGGNMRALRFSSSVETELTFFLLD
jgi:hypothetical protein